MGNKTFLPTGVTQNEAVTTSAETISLSAKLNDIDGSVRLLVIGTQTVFVRLDGTAPTTANGIPLRPDQPETFAMPTGGLDIKHIAGAAGSTLYVTPGRWA
jgi:hypothetical protein